MNDGDLESLATQFGERLAKKFGLETLRKIDKDNESLKDVIHDAVHDHIDMASFYQEYQEACTDIGFDSKNYKYAPVFEMLKRDGYATWGDNYEIGG